MPKIITETENRQSEFCKDRISWSYEQCASVIFSDEAPIYLCEPSNRQIDRVWSSNGPNIPPVLTIKLPPAFDCLGCMSARAVSQLHFIPQKCSVNDKYYVEDILAGSCRDAFARKRSTGTILQRKLCENMSDSIFTQDGVPVQPQFYTRLANPIRHPIYQIFEHHWIYFSSHSF